MDRPPGRLQPQRLGMIAQRASDGEGGLGQSLFGADRELLRGQ